MTSGPSIRLPKNRTKRYGCVLHVLKIGQRRSACSKRSMGRSDCPRPPFHILLSAPGRFPGRATLAPLARGLGSCLLYLMLDVLGTNNGFACEERRHKPLLTTLESSLLAHGARSVYSHVPVCWIGARPVVRTSRVARETRGPSDLYPASCKTRDPRCVHLAGLPPEPSRPKSLSRSPKISHVFVSVCKILNPCRCAHSWHTGGSGTHQTHAPKNRGVRRTFRGPG